MSNQSDVSPPDFDQVLAARQRIAGHTHRTPVLASAFFDSLLGASLYFKCENLQKVGAFKARGACNAVFSLDPDTLERGVITHSSGNHGQAISYAAARRGISSTIVMPSTAPAAKKAAIQGYGGTVIECAPNEQARQQTVDDQIAQSGAGFVHPFNDSRVIAGQATCALELLEQVDSLDIIIAPIGGGGLVSGCCLSAMAKAPGTRVFGAEPAKVDDAARSLRAGKLVNNDSFNTIADGLKTNLGPLTWQIISRHVSEIVVASEQKIIETMKLIWQRMKIVVEPSSAVVLAAMLENPAAFQGQRIGVIFSGGNVDLGKLPWQ